METHTNEQPVSALLTYREAAALLNLALPTIYSKVSRKELPHVRLGSRCVRFERERLLSWLEERRVEPGLVLEKP
ncbi:MAG: excisionase family DNA-binding protein [Myxococcales bacterium]|nr:excisionase family DNA-binding protein [Myxococcales bacterium]